MKDIPVMADDEYLEYQKILKYSHPKLQDYFGITKSIWAVVYESIQVSVKKNKNNLESNTGFFFYKTKEETYIWRYNTRKIPKSNNETKTFLKLVHQGSLEDLTTNDLILKFLSTKEEVKTHKFPVFEVTCNDVFPLEETLVPIFKRKIMAYIAQSIKKEPKKLLSNGI